MSDILLHSASAASILAVALLAYGAAHDVAVRTIPDLVPVGVLAAGLLMRLAAGDWGWALPVALLVFALGALAWRFGLLGGGDVKLMAAVTTLLPPGRTLDLMTGIILVGGVLALVFLALRRLVPAARRGEARPRGLAARLWRAERRRIARGGPLPYAVAIALGSWWAMAQGQGGP